ncbi:thioredoxin domain-containing protein [Micromonospora sp. NPDC049559]|uniref:TlpA family protein disulfide reductase n=1 Tax=Micromonospora sp. NPDC049559 TaxID=3155923 RepID=UPI003441B7BB
MEGPTLAGALVVVAVLAVATGFGLWGQRRDGRLRPVAGPEPVGPEPVVGPAPVGLAPARPGTPASAPAGPATPTPVAAPVESGVLAGLGVEPGVPATLVQFSSAFCAPCRATRRMLDEVSGLLPGVRHVEVDAESHLDAVRALDIWRTPTVLVVDADGRIVQRAAGVPTKAQVVAALAPLLSGARP